MLYAKFGRNWISGFEEDENVKSFIQTDGWMDGQMTGNQKSSLELSAQVIKLKFDPSHFALIVMTIYHTCIPNNITY